MAILEKDIKFIREKLESSVRPMFFFDDDADGLCSFLLLYRLVKEGRGVIIKTAPDLSDKYVDNVKNYSPDLIFILDKPQVSQDFLDKMTVPVIWIDHHQPIKRHKVHYFNPRINDDKDNRPTTYWAYKIADQDMWIGTIGCIADWHFLPFFKEFSKKYPKLLSTKIKTPERALYESKAGELARLFSFILKGKINEALAAIKILTRIKSPEEILDQTTPQGKFIYKRYKKIKKDYDEIKAEVKATSSKLLLFRYPPDRMSFTSELSNEILYRYPKKMIIICREKSGEMRCSLRSAKYKVAPRLKAALKEVEGYGGGHEYACGASIKETDFKKFVKHIKGQLS